MNWTSALAIYVLFWVLTAFVVMPFFAKTSEESGEALVPGQAESAPHEFKPRKIMLWTTAVSALFFGLFYVNYVRGFVGPDVLDFLSP
jgi:predicted secreted protein